MTPADIELERRRESNGRFGAGHNSAPDVSLVPEPLIPFDRANELAASYLEQFPGTDRASMSKAVYGAARAVAADPASKAMTQHEALAAAADMFDQCQCVQMDGCGNQIQEQGCPHHGDATAVHVGRAVVEQLRRLANSHLAEAGLPAAHRAAAQAIGYGDDAPF